jgi:hypothetical protein
LRLWRWSGLLLSGGAPGQCYPHADDHSTYFQRRKSHANTPFPVGGAAILGQFWGRPGCLDARGWNPVASCRNGQIAKSRRWRGFPP